MEIVLRVRESYSKQVYALRVVVCAERLLSARWSAMRRAPFYFTRVCASHTRAGIAAMLAHAHAFDTLCPGPCTYHPNYNNKNNNNELLLLLLFFNVDNLTDPSIKAA